MYVSRFLRAVLDRLAKRLITFQLEFLYKNELIKQFLSVAPGSLDYSVLSRLVKSEPRDPSERRQPFTTREIKVPEDAVNDLFSRHGTKVSEIKYVRMVMRHSARLGILHRNLRVGK